MQAKRKLSTTQKVVLGIIAIASSVGTFVRAYFDIVNGEISTIQLLAGGLVLLFCGVIIWHARRSSSNVNLERSFELAKRLEADKRGA